jgi:triosephosphate isomerase
MRKMIAGTGWKMNIGAAEAVGYAQKLNICLSAVSREQVEMFVLPPFTSLHAAHAAFSLLPVGIGGQNMHWEASGAWTGEISAPMLVEAGCRYVELAHSERLQHFGETYEFVRRKVNIAMASGLVPILCLGEMAEDKQQGRADQVLADQVSTALKDQPAHKIPEIILAYEPRWAIGAADAASPEYVAARHAALRRWLQDNYGAHVAEKTRIIYGGSVNAQNGPALLECPDVDGLFVGRAAWTPEGFAEIAEIVARAAAQRRSS